MKLSIVTVVFNDLVELKKTVESVIPVLQSGDVEYWIIDGDSNDYTSEYLESLSKLGVNWISEPDSGLYDAMNKSLEYISGDFVQFLNAGDLLHSGFSFDEFLLHDPSRSKVLLGCCIERYGRDYYLNPGLGREINAFSSPQHQATFYPRDYYQKARYKLDLNIGSDTNYTYYAIHEYGAIFVPSIVCEFQLGGISSSYGSLKVILSRLNESHKLKLFVKLFMKIIMWHTLPRRAFYRALAFGKYTHTSSTETIKLSDEVIERTPKFG